MITKPLNSLMDNKLYSVSDVIPYLIIMMHKSKLSLGDLPIPEGSGAEHKPSTCSNGRTNLVVDLLTQSTSFKRRLLIPSGPFSNVLFLRLFLIIFIALLPMQRC
ncbi:MAG TPA: hypothetical protein VD815_09975 [Candidatus Saccharimonadales bacterium]|nr:hypothetical protein [Candidatus Saccharimonadales bacterium]